MSQSTACTACSLFEIALIAFPVILFVCLVFENFTFLERNLLTRWILVIFRLRSTLRQKKSKNVRVITSVVLIFLTKSKETSHTNLTLKLWYFAALCLNTTVRTVWNIIWSPHKNRCWSRYNGYTVCQKPDISRCVCSSLPIFYSFGSWSLHVGGSRVSGRISVTPHYKLTL